MSVQLSNGASAVKTQRRPLDYYPTPIPVVDVLRRWFEARTDAPAPRSRFLDPSAGTGSIIAAMRDGAWGESLWHAIEIDPSRADDLELVAEDVQIGDALTIPWPAATVVQNPPFSLLDEFWLAAERHSLRHGVWCATLTPVAWWNAEKRRSYRRPDAILALGWRPAFHAKEGPAHKGSQDFCWSILSPVPAPVCSWQRVEKPRMEADQCA